jgi:hypothetical protein
VLLVEGTEHRRVAHRVLVAVVLPEAYESDLHRQLPVVGLAHQVTLLAGVGIGNARRHVVVERIVGQCIEEELDLPFLLEGTESGLKAVVFGLDVDRRDDGREISRQTRQCLDLVLGMSLTLWPAGLERLARYTSPIRGGRRRVLPGVGYRSTSPMTVSRLPSVATRSGMYSLSVVAGSARTCEKDGPRVSNRGGLVGAVRPGPPRNTSGKSRMS